MAPWTERRRVRLRLDSTFALDFNLPLGAVGVITARFKERGKVLLNLEIEGIEGIGFVSGVPEAEVERVTGP